jgi:hypothetical protein
VFGRSECGEEVGIHSHFVSVLFRSPQLYLTAPSLPTTKLALRQIVITRPMVDPTGVENQAAEDSPSGTGIPDGKLAAAARMVYTGTPHNCARTLVVLVCKANTRTPWSYSVASACSSQINPGRSQVGVPHTSAVSG